MNTLTLEILDRFSIGWTNSSPIWQTLIRPPYPISASDSIYSRGNVGIDSNYSLYIIYILHKWSISLLIHFSMLQIRRPSGFYYWDSSDCFHSHSLLGIRFSIEFDKLVIHIDYKIRTIYLYLEYLDWLCIYLSMKLWRGETQISLV